MGLTVMEDNFKACIYYLVIDKTLMWLRVKFKRMQSVNILV